MPNLIGTAPNQVPTNGALGNMAFQNKEAVSVDTLVTTGNLGLGVSPSAWGSGFKAFEFGNSATQTGALFSNNTNDTWFVSNAYFNGSNFIYKSSGYATAVEQIFGAHKWYTAPSGTVGNAISFTQAMTLDASGNVQIGTSLDYGRLTAAESVASGDTNISIYNSAGAAVSGVQGTKISFLNDSGFSEANPAAYIQSRSNDGGAGGQTSMRFGVYNGSAAAEAMRITSAGNVGIGTSSPGAKFEVFGNNARSVAKAFNTAGVVYLQAQANDYSTSFIGTAISQFSSAAAGTTCGLSNASLGMLEFQNASAGLIYTNGGSPLVFGTVSQERMRIDNAGNVGIGTSSPTDSLHVRGTAQRFDKSNAVAVGQIRLLTTTDSYATAWALGQPASSTNFAIQYFNGSSWSTSATVDTSGNVGIGTTSPGGNSTNRVVNAYGSTSGAFKAQSSVTAATLGAGGAEGYVEVTGAYPLQFIVNGSERARIDSSGNLLVGTTTVAGVASNTAIVTNGGIKTASGPISVATATATTVFSITAGNRGRYEVMAMLPNSGDAAQYTAIATVIWDGSTGRIVANNGTKMTLTLSGSDVQVTQTSGSTQTLYWSVQRIAL